MAKSAKSTQPATTTTDEDLSWLDAGKNYSLGLDQGKIVCRNPAGKRLASVPKELKESELGEQLSALSEWLVEHRTECEHRIEMWMLRSLPVPREVIQAVWTDTDWSDMLRNLAVIPVDANGKANSVKTGLLRDVHPQKGVGVVDRDGETQWLTSAQILIPHPILIEGLEDLREIVADMGFVQQVEQLFRPVFAATPEQKKLSSISDYSNGMFDQLNFVSSLCRRLGYPVRGGSACCKVWENTKPIEARFWVGDDYPESETRTGDLIFVDHEQKPQEIASIGRVTFSEGVRMATQIYARRKVEKEEEGGQ